MTATTRRSHAGVHWVWVNAGSRAFPPTQYAVAGRGNGYIMAGKLWSLRRLADADGRFTMIAVDQRPGGGALIRSGPAPGMRGVEDRPAEAT